MQEQDDFLPSYYHQETMGKIFQLEYQIFMETNCRQSLVVIDIF